MNIELTADTPAAIADAVLGKMELAAICRLVAGDLETARAALRDVAGRLDAVAILGLMYLVAAVEEKDIHDPLVAATTVTILEGINAKRDKTKLPVWPDPVETVRLYYASTPRGPLVTTFEDGAVCTTYWLNGALHRDPNDGPAWHRKDAAGEQWQYILHGQCDRDAAVGPAIIYTQYDGKPVAGEEYFRDGKAPPV